MRAVEGRGEAGGVVGAVRVGAYCLGGLGVGGGGCGLLGGWGFVEYRFYG